ncbi:hypothetical protein K2173_007863 [Erythroxylum novogranatense]|uniref:Uncharacterized protein n=1 Tax=Erythroxylum novogranatense TaxID=1862640 RepID=A0AAV8T7W6_9ROSI|nr:hypothetical protein K2173_007863 [Erythroxylum novogranatense]
MCEIFSFPPYDAHSLRSFLAPSRFLYLFPQKIKNFRELKQDAFVCFLEFTVQASMLVYSLLFMCRRAGNWRIKRSELGRELEFIHTMFRNEDINVSTRFEVSFSLFFLSRCYYAFKAVYLYHIVLLDIVCY